MLNLFYFLFHLFITLIITFLTYFAQKIRSFWWNCLGNTKLFIAFLTLTTNEFNIINFQFFINCFVTDYTSFLLHILVFEWTSIQSFKLPFTLPSIILLLYSDSSNILLFLLETYCSIALDDNAYSDDNTISSSSSANNIFDIIISLYGDFEWSLLSTSFFLLFLFTRSILLIGNNDFF